VITVVTAAIPSPASPLKPEIMDPVERVTKRLWNIPVVPVMETGATDGLYLRNGRNSGVRCLRVFVGHQRHSRARAG